VKGALANQGYDLTDFNITDEDFEGLEAEAEFERDYHNLEGETVLPDNGYEMLLTPDDWDNEPLNFTEFDFEKFQEGEWPPVVEYDYQYNVHSLFMALNTYRMNLTILERTVRD
jgi:hypothetical protein